MTTVVDASVVVASLLDIGPAGQWAERIMGRGVLHAPELVMAETAQAIRHLERARRISRPEAEAAFNNLMELDLRLYSFAPLAARVWELRHAATSYDAWYVAVAEALELPLATLDLRLVRAAGLSCRFLTFEARS